MENGRNEPTHKAMGTQHWVANGEVIVGVAGTLSSQDAVMGIRDGKPGNGGTEGGPQLHALQDEVDPDLLATLHAPQGGAE
jgi:hypothetical protein